MEGDDFIQVRQVTLLLESGMNAGAKVVEKGGSSRMACSGIV